MKRRTFLASFLSLVIFPLSAFGTETKPYKLLKITIDSSMYFGGYVETIYFKLEKKAEAIELLDLYLEEAREKGYKSIKHTIAIVDFKKGLQEYIYKL